MAAPHGKNIEKKAIFVWDETNKDYVAWEGVEIVGLKDSIGTTINPATEDTLLNIKTNTTTATGVGSGKKTVTTAGTQVAIGTSTTIKSVTVKALVSNTGLIYVGASTVASTDGFELSPGDSISMDVDNLTDVYVDSAVNGEGVSYLYTV